MTSSIHTSYAEFFNFAENKIVRGGYTVLKDFLEKHYPAPNYNAPRFFWVRLASLVPSAWAVASISVIAAVELFASAFFALHYWHTKDPQSKSQALKSLTNFVGSPFVACAALFAGIAFPDFLLHFDDYVPPS